MFGSFLSAGPRAEAEAGTVGAGAACGSLLPGQALRPEGNTIPAVFSWTPQRSQGREVL